MTTNEKKLFIRTLCNRLRDEAIYKVLDLPDEWDANELRCMVAYRHSLEASITVIRKYPQTTRARSYRRILRTLFLT